MYGLLKIINGFAKKIKKGTVLLDMPHAVSKYYEHIILVEMPGIINYYVRTYLWKKVQVNL